MSFDHEAGTPGHAEIKALLTEQREVFAKHAGRVDDLEKAFGRLQAQSGWTTGGGTADPVAPEAKAAYDRLVRSGDDTGIKAMSVGTDPDGGYLVGSVIAPDIYRALLTFSPFRGLVRNVTIDRGDAWETPQDSGGTIPSAWVGETESRPATAGPGLQNLRIPVPEIYAMPEITQKLLDTSSFDAGGYLNTKLAEAFALKTGDAYINGDGSAKPRGILTYPVSTAVDGARPWGTVQVIPTGAAGDFLTAGDPNGAEVFIDTIASLKAPYRANAQWVMNRLTFASVAKLKDGQGRFLLEFNAALGTPPSLLGYPVVTVEEMPNIASGSLSIGFGDWSRAYVVVDSTGIRMLRDPYTAKPFVRFYSTMRTGGGMLDSTAFKLIRFSVS